MSASLSQLTLWDTAGQERSRGGLVPLFYRDADAAVFVYDITNWRSFENISQWLQEMGSYCDLSQSVLVLVGNKRDQEEDRKVDRGTAERLSVSRHMLYREVSSHSINHLQEVNGGWHPLDDCCAANNADCVCSGRRWRGKREIGYWIEASLYVDSHTAKLPPSVVYNQVESVAKVVN